eukprot:m51a1_g5651 putative ankyrin-3 isoform 2 (555) ;mRNA; r:867047-869116
MAHQSQPSEHFIDNAPRIDRDAAMNKLQQEDIVKKEADVREWIERVIGQKLAPNMHEAIGDGVVLCQVLNKIQPGSVLKIHPSQSAPFQLRENITKFLAVINQLQIPEAACFAVEDLFLAKNMRNVYTCIVTLADMATKKGFEIKWTAEVDVPFFIKSPANRGLTSPRIVVAAASVSVTASTSKVSKEVLDEYNDAAKRINNGSTALHIAAARGDAAACEQLIEQGANVNARRNDGSTPLHVAVAADKPEASKVLLSRGASSLAADARGVTPTAVAAASGKAPLIEVIASGTGSTPQAVDKAGRQELFAAITVGNVAAVDYLCKCGFGPNTESDSGATVLVYSATAGNAEVLRLMVDHFNCSPDTHVKGNIPLLMMAIDAGNSDAAVVLIDRGANVNAGTTDGWTPLHYAIVKKLYVVCAKLLEKKANANAPNPAAKNCTALHLAIGKKTAQMDLIELLLNSGADPNAKNANGLTSLHSAVFWGHADVVSLLLDRGADINARTEHMRTAMDLAVYYGYQNVADILAARAGVQAPTVYTRGNSAKHKRMPKPSLF